MIRVISNPLASTISGAKSGGIKVDAALILCLLVLRGGSASQDVINSDWHEWLNQHGEPTWESIEAWATASETDAVLALSFKLGEERPCP